MLLSTAVRVTAYIVLGLYALALILFGVTVPSLMTKILAYIPTALVILFAVFDKWAWHWPGIIKIVKRPLVAGTWAGKLTSYRLDENNNDISSEHDVVLVARQTFTTLSLTLLTSESKSRSVAEMIRREANGDFSIHYQYQNRPSLEYRDASPIHPGSAALEVVGSTPLDLSAEYWTARKSRGTFALKKVSSKQAGSFAEGQALIPVNQGA